MMPIPAKRASWGVRSWMGLPSMRISPESGRYAPARIFINVLLPAPFSPIRACTSPCQIWRSTFLSARTPGKLLLIPRTSRTGRALLGPAFVLSDIFFGDQVHRNQSELLRRLLTIHNVVTNRDRFLGHCVRILGRACRNQTIRVLQRGYHIGCTIDADDEKVLTLRLFGGQVAADSGWIVDGEHGIDLGECGQEGGHYPN